MTTSQYDQLRYVRFDGYTLQVWDTRRTDSMGKSVLAYEMKTPSGVTLFEGQDFSCSPMQAIDSDTMLRYLLGFLTLKPGDTDAEYFDSYTPEQMAFAEGDAEQLQIWSMDSPGDDEYALPLFEDLTGGRDNAH